MYPTERKNIYNAPPNLSHSGNTASPTIYIDSIMPYTPNNTNVNIQDSIMTTTITATNGYFTNVSTPLIESPTIYCTNFDDYRGNPILITSTGGTPTFQQSISLNSNNISSVGTLLATTVNPTNLGSMVLQGTLAANAHNITNCNDFNAALISASSKVECPTYCNI